MSIERCSIHQVRWDSDFMEECPSCLTAQVEAAMTHDPYECEYEHCRQCREYWIDEKDDIATRKEE